MFGGKYLRDSRSKTKGSDPFLIRQEYKSEDKYAHISTLRGGYIVEIYPEPIFDHTYVEVQYLSGGPSTLVKWPGPNVETTKSGSRGKATVPHGIYRGPKKYQKVLIGFEDGDYTQPSVIESYPNEFINDGINDIAHANPLNSMGFDSDDVILGHYSGSYLVFRGVAPIPGDIEMYGEATVTVSSLDIKIGRDETREAAVLGNQLITLLKSITSELSDLAGICAEPANIITADTTPAQFTPDNIIALGVIQANLAALETAGNALGINSPMLSTQVKISK